MKRKGFTLIELLAVILILGIIALIAIPTVTGVIKESEKRILKISTENLIKAVETKCQLEQLEGETIIKEYEITDGKISPDLEIKGELPEDGSIRVDDSCEAQLYLMDDKGYIAYKFYEDFVIVF